MLDSVHNDENKPVRMAFDLTHQRVEHYSDVVEYLVRTEVARCKYQEGFDPTPEQIKFLEKEIVRYATIRKDMTTAQKLRIKKNGNLLLT